MVPRKQTPREARLLKALHDAGFEAAIDFDSVTLQISIPHGSESIELGLDDYVADPEAAVLKAQNGLQSGKKRMFNSTAGHPHHEFFGTDHISFRSG